jgi:glutamate synthase domain-containing protein 1
VKAEVIPTRTIPAITDEPLIWRYFVTPLRSVLASMQVDENEYIARIVMQINTSIPGAHVFSSGKNMGVFKAVGFPEDVGEFYRLEEYGAYSWTAHGRYPENTSRWWGGPTLRRLDWTVVHNGEISPTTNRADRNVRLLVPLQTDTEVIIQRDISAQAGVTLQRPPRAPALWGPPPAPRRKRNTSSIFARFHPDPGVFLIFGFTGGRWPSTTGC